MTIGQILCINLLVIALALLILWGVSLLRRDASIIDLFWGFGFALVSWFSAWASGPVPARCLLLVLLVTVWGLRLSGYLAWRNWGKPEDYRYAAMRGRYGRMFPLVSLFTVFGVQGLLMWVISLPLQIGIYRAPNWSIAAGVGVIVWAAGLFFEAVGDLQLARFKADVANHGRVMNWGLWRYTRHPNYFGDFLVWWGFYLVAAEPSSWWWTIISPLLMSFLLIRVSGVRLLESSLPSRVAGYQDYVQTTSSFFPRPPRRKA